MSKIAPQLGTVQETLLITLYGRAVETADPGGMLRDPKSVEVTEAIDYDFAKFDGKPSLLGVNFRTLLYDSWVRRFLAEHPTGTVVELGCGLNTRLERTDNGTAHWVELDLPDAVDLRRHFFAESDRRTIIGASVLDTSWHDRVAALPGPYLFVAEAVLPFLDEDRVRSFVRDLSGRFPGALLATDTSAQDMVDTQDQHDVLSMMAARMVWACDDPRAVETWEPEPGPRLLESRTFLDFPSELTDPLSAARKAFVQVMRTDFRDKAESYRFNLFRLAG
ncbi:class I SAM-dependent methyltransferase [Streptomyces apocyni]|uniref:class I SAM-dependent methyltransferase n=1 Tax=Streptomyces apocyni TaxID=2654677 RepID=UPI0012EA0E3B|nr:class I SAM-dependent methyltransferase [Streptomyces apocyni]